jgi:uncharacterized protein DUF4230
MRPRILRATIALVIAAALLLGAGWWFGRMVERAVNPPPETIVSASLQGLRAQNRLSAFIASYVAVVTSTQSRFGLSTSKTLIVPGLVRYEVDMARIRDDDVRWDGKARQLSVTLPNVDVVGPQIDLTRIREYGSGGLLVRLTDAEKTLDAANRRAGQSELLRQARQPLPISLAKDATRRAIARSFALPLRAVGVDASVRVRFTDEPDFPKTETEWIDHSRSIAEVYANSQ